MHVFGTQDDLIEWVCRVDLGISFVIVILKFDVKRWTIENEYLCVVRL